LCFVYAGIGSNITTIISASIGFKLVSNYLFDGIKNCRILFRKFFESVIIPWRSKIVALYVLKPETILGAKGVEVQKKCSSIPSP
jgi:hypothetical protein